MAYYLLLLIQYRRSGYVERNLFESFWLRFNTNIMYYVYKYISLTGSRLMSLNLKNAVGPRKAQVLDVILWVK